MPASIYGDPGTLYGTAIYGAEADPVPLSGSDLHVEMFALNEWYNVTSFVRTEEGVSYVRGYAPDSTQISPGSASFTLDNTSGEFSPRKSNSFASEAGRNVPVRIGLGKPCIGTARRSEQTGIPHPSTRNIDQSTDPCLNVFWCAAEPVMNITGPVGMTDVLEWDGSIVTVYIASLVDADGTIPSRATQAESPTETDWAACSVGLPGTWTYVDDGSGTAGASATTLTVDTANGRHVFIGVSWSADPAGMQAPPLFVGQSHIEWVLVADSGRYDGPRCAGWYGYLTDDGSYSFVVAGDIGAGDCHAFLYQSDDAPAYSPRFTGVVRDWPIQWDKSGANIRVDVDAAGGLYQGRQDALPMSAMRQALGPRAVHYWPMEDESGPGFTAATEGTPRLQVAATGTDTAPVYGTYSGFVGSAELPTFTDSGAYATFTGWDAGVEGFCSSLLINVPSGGAGAGANFVVYEFTGGSIDTIGIEYTSNTQATIKVTYNDGTATASNLFTFASPFPTGWDGGNVLLYVKALNVGADVTITVSVADVTWDEGVDITFSTGSTTKTTKTLGSIRGVRLGMEVGSGNTLLVLDPALGHLAIAKGTDLPLNIAFYGAVGFATAGFGFNSLFAAAPTRATVATHPSASAGQEGPIPYGSAPERIANLETTAQAMVVDAAGFVGLNIWHRTLQESREYAAEWSYPDQQLTDPLEPVDDDQAVMNRVTVRRGEYGEASAEVREGTLGTEEIGPYSQQEDALTNTTAQLEDLAEWLVALGTVDVQRWPSLTVEWGNAANASNISLPDLVIGSWFNLTDLPTYVGPDVETLVIGIRETIWTYAVRTTYVTKPAAGWRVMRVDDLGWDTVADEDNPTDTDMRVGL